VFACSLPGGRLAPLPPVSYATGNTIHVWFRISLMAWCRSYSLRNNRFLRNVALGPHSLTEGFGALSRLKLYFIAKQKMSCKHFWYLTNIIVKRKFETPLGKFALPCSYKSRFLTTGLLHKQPCTLRSEWYWHKMKMSAI